MKTTCAAIAAMFMIACSPAGPDIDATHTKYLVYDWNTDTRAYELHVSEIETLDDPRAISGEVARLRGGGALVVANSEPTTKEEYAELLEVRNDKTPSAEYFFDGEVAVPFDFDTQLMVTLYHHIERADRYFGDLGVDPLGQMPTYYFPQFSLFGIPLPLLTDNAAYAFTLDAFLIPPTVFLVDDVPLSANRGVMVHEYSHAVFNRLVHLDDRAPGPLWDPSFPDDMVNELRSLDEGVADVFGALATGDADFIAPSISKEAFGLDRDLTRKRIWNAELQEEIDEAETGLAPNPYLLGSVVASAIWATRDFLDDEAVALTTLAALREIAEPKPEFRLSNYLNAWLDELGTADRESACEIFVERFELIRDDLTCAD